MAFDAETETTVTSRVLLEAVDLIEKRGWVQGEFENENGLCALGAIKVAVEKVGWRQGVYAEAVNQLRAQVPGSIMFWNDEAGQTKENVLSTLRRVARGL